MNGTTPCLGPRYQDLKISLIKYNALLVADQGEVVVHHII